MSPAGELVDAATTAPGEGGLEPITLCIVSSSDAAADFSAEHGLPVRTLCGKWVYPDAEAEAEAASGCRSVNCLDCGTAYAGRRRE